MVVRPFNAYGPRAHFAGPYGEVIPRFAILARAGLAPVIFGDGKQTRDFTYVEDTARGLIEAAATDQLLGSSINLAKGTEVTIRDLAQLITKLARAKVNPRFVGDRPGDIIRLGCDISKAKQFLAHLPHTSIEEGIKRYFHWLDAKKVDYEALARQLAEKNWTQSAKEKDQLVKAA